MKNMRKLHDRILRYMRASNAVLISSKDVRCELLVLIIAY